MRRPIIIAAALLALSAPVLAAGSQPHQAQAATPKIESVTFKGSSGQVTIYSSSAHQALKVEASSSTLSVKLTSHTGQVVSCAKSCTYKTPFSWGSVSYKSGTNTVTQLNQAVASERHLPKTRQYHGKNSFVVAFDQGTIRIVLTSAGDVTFCQALEPFPGYLKFTLKNGKTVQCPTDKNYGFETSATWASFTSYSTSTGSAVKGETLYRADVVAANR
jgi:hypothetical protein